MDVFFFFLCLWARKSVCACVGKEKSRAPGRPPFFFFLEGWTLEPLIVASRSPAFECAPRIRSPRSALHPNHACSHPIS
jgi:hypothetical protein